LRHGGGDSMLKIIPFEGYSFGATVSRAAVQEILKSSDLQKQLVDAFNEHCLLVLHDQNLIPSEEMAIAKLFPHNADVPVEERAGPYSEHWKKWKLPHLQEVQIQGWGEVEDHYGVSGTLAPKVETREWHTDGIHELNCAPVLTSMYAISAPPVGGETLFISGYNVWDALPIARRAEVGHLCVHYKRKPNRMSEDGTHATIDAETNVENGPGGVLIEASSCISSSHPLFRLHPSTGRVALHVAPLFMHSIEGMDESDAFALVSEMIKLAVPGMYAHVFKKGDIVLWDNRCLLHSASPCHSKQGLRLLHRIRMSSQEVAVPAISSDEVPHEKVQQLEEHLRTEPPSKRWCTLNNHQGHLDRQSGCSHGHSGVDQILTDE